MKYFLLKALLLFFLGSSYLSATHIHHDDLGHEDGCEVCVIVSNFHSADIPDSQIHIASLKSSYFIYTHLNISVPHKIQKGFYSTAPPSL